MRRLFALAVFLGIACASALAVTLRDAPDYRPAVRAAAVAAPPAGAPAATTSVPPIERIARVAAPERTRVARPSIETLVEDEPLPLTLPLYVDIVDAETGRPTAVDWVEVAPDGDVLDEDNCLILPSDWWEFEAVFAEGGGEQSVDIFIDAGTGESRRYPDPLRRERVTATLSRFAEAFRVIEPLRPEARVALRVTDPDGRRTTVDSIRRFEYAGKWITATLGTDVTLDAQVVAGFAHLAGEPVKIYASGGELVGEGTVTLNHDPTDVPVLDLQLDEFTGRRGGRRCMTTGCGVGRQRERGDNTGRIEVTVVSRDYERLAGVLVDAGSAGSGRTDEYGRVTFEGLEDRTYSLRLLEPGLAYAAAKATVADGGLTSAMLREGRSYDLDVLVLDENRDPAKFARIDVQPSLGAPWVHLVDGTQTLTVMTDENGRCRLPDLPWVSLRIVAHFGSRTGDTFSEPGTERVEIALRRRSSFATR